MMIVAPRASVFVSGKACPECQRGELEAGHPRMVDGARRRPEAKEAARMQSHYVMGSKLDILRFKSFMPDKILSRQPNRIAIAALLLLALTPPADLPARDIPTARPVSPSLPPATEEIAPGLTVTFKNASGKDVRDARLAAIYVPEGASPTPFLEPGPFTATWEGFVNADLGTDCTFSARGRGRLTITVNDEVAFEAEGEDFSTAIGEEMFLKNISSPVAVEKSSPSASSATSSLTVTVSLPRPRALKVQSVPRSALTKPSQVAVKGPGLRNGVGDASSGT